jgi:hypothetical protein
VSWLFNNHTLNGSDSPSADGRNSLISLFEKINATKRLGDLFTIVEPLIRQSDDLKNCVNFISLSILHLYHGQEPPVSCFPVLKYCSELRSSFSFFGGFANAARNALNNLIDPNKILKKGK